jgi:hypothetical protein
MTPNPPPPFVDAAGRSTSLTRASPSEIDGMQTHLQRLHGVDEGDFRTRTFPPPEHCEAHWFPYDPVRVVNAVS